MRQPIKMLNRQRRLVILVIAIAMAIAWSASATPAIAAPAGGPVGHRSQRGRREHGQCHLDRPPRRRKGLPGGVEARRRELEGLGQLRLERISLRHQSHHHWAGTRYHLQGQGQGPVPQRPDLRMEQRGDRYDARRRAHRTEQSPRSPTEPARLQFVDGYL